jgi:hypothetical protein
MTPTGRRIIFNRSPQQFELGRTTVLGGICSLFTADWEKLRRGEIRFDSLPQFAQWLSSWYPRIDQVFGCVGVPPCGVRRVLYVTEDSLFAERLNGLYPRWDRRELSALFREIQERFGCPAIRRWLSESGYQGVIETVYTSQLEVEMRIAFACFERSVGAALGESNFRFAPGARTQALIKMMYTPFWSAVLGIDDVALVYEPAAYGLDADAVRGLSAWQKMNPYGDSRGLCANFGRIGFAELALEAEGPNRVTRTFERILNRTNYRQKLSLCARERLDDREVPALFGQLCGESQKVEINAMRRVLLLKLQSVME